MIDSSLSREIFSKQRFWRFPAFSIFFQNSNFSISSKARWDGVLLFQRTPKLTWNCMRGGEVLRIENESHENDIRDTVYKRGGNSSLVTETCCSPPCELFGFCAALQSTGHEADRTMITWSTSDAFKNTHPCLERYTGSDRRKTLSANAVVSTRLPYIVERRRPHF